MFDRYRPVPYIHIGAKPSLFRVSDNGKLLVELEFCYINPKDLLTFNDWTFLKGDVKQDINHHPRFSLISVNRQSQSATSILQLPPSKIKQWVKKD